MREIIGFEGLYKIDEQGNIYGMKKQKFISQRIINSGYKIVDLYKCNVRYQMLVHRIVAQTFIENLNDFPIVNHKDKNKLNNDVNNLEWCTYKYNLEYSDCIKNANKSRMKKVKQIKNEIVINIYNSISEAKMFTGVNGSNISECCSGKRNTAGGYKWEIV